MTPDSFQEFPIGTELNLAAYVAEEEYNPIGHPDTPISGYYFFCRDIDLGVCLDEQGRITSFDIQLRKQEKRLFPGSKEGKSFCLNDCRLDNLLSYLNAANLPWKFDRIIAGNSISVACFLDLQLTFYFDFEETSNLTLLCLEKPRT